MLYKSSFTTLPVSKAIKDLNFALLQKKKKKNQNEKRERKACWYSHSFKSRVIGNLCFCTIYLNSNPISALLPDFQISPVA